MAGPAGAVRSMPIKLSLWGISGHHHVVICTTIYGIDHGLLMIGGLPIVYGCRYFTGETVQFFH